MGRVRIATLETNHDILEALALGWKSRHVKKMGAQLSAIIVRHLLVRFHVVLHYEIILVLLRVSARQIEGAFMDCNLVLLHLVEPLVSLICFG